MKELLIPFGIHKDSKEILEPEDVVSGRACGCVCPGCDAPLLARHSKLEDRRSHFAHDSLQKEAKPDFHCIFSPAVALAMMIRHIAERIVDAEFHTPKYSLLYSFNCCEDVQCLDVTHASKNVVEAVSVRPDLEGGTVDLVVTIGGRLLYVDLVYEGKSEIVLNKSTLQANGAALLSLNCDTFNIRSLDDNKRLKYSEAALHFLLEDGERKWLVHPKEKRKIENIKALHTCSKEYSEEIFQTPKSAPYERPARAYRAPVLDPAMYFCVFCDVEWLHDYSKELQCPKCRSHLYSRRV